MAKNCRPPISAPGSFGSSLPGFAVLLDDFGGDNDAAAPEAFEASAGAEQRRVPVSRMALSRPMPSPAQQRCLHHQERKEDIAGMTMTNCTIEGVSFIYFFVRLCWALWRCRKRRPASQRSSPALCFCRACPRRGRPSTGWTRRSTQLHAEHVTPRLTLADASKLMNTTKWKILPCGSKPPHIRTAAQTGCLQLSQAGTPTNLILCRGRVGPPLPLAASEVEPPPADDGNHVSGQR